MHRPCDIVERSTTSRWPCAIVCLAACLHLGCFARVDSHCAGCAIVEFRRPQPPPIAEGQRALVVLLHGAFGFGPEWEPILRALHARPELSFWVFAWPGPFGGKPPSRAEAFRVALQRSVSSLPSSVHDVVVLAHSAGGPVAEYAARRLVVPFGVRVRVALLDAVRLTMSPEIRTEHIDTPLGTSLGATVAPEPAVPTGVVLEEYRAGEPARHELGMNEVANGAHVTYLGRKVTHGGSVGLAGLPLIKGL
jgi:pimeloyl-ACP methyl ester carboxylesterase